MNYRFAHRSALILSALFCLETILLITDHPLISTIDHTVIGSVQAHITPFKTSLAKSFTFLANVPSLSIIMLFFSFLIYRISRRPYETLWFLFHQAIGAGAVNGLIKLFIARKRPTILRLDDIGGYSFPSGHTMGAAICYVTFALWLYHYYLNTQSSSTRKIQASSSLYYRIFIAISFLLVFAIAWSRIYLGVHYPTDVLAGGFLGFAWVIIAFRSREWPFLANKLKKRSL